MAFSHVLERKIENDLALINSKTQSLCVLDENGEIVWNLLKDVGSIETVKDLIDIPSESREDFEDFCKDLQAFIKGDISDQPKGISLHQYFL